MTDPLDTYDTFTAAVRARLEAGAEAYRDRPTASRPLPELASELRSEIEDTAGWAATLWPRLVALETALGRLDTSPAEAEQTSVQHTIAENPPSPHGGAKGTVGEFETATRAGVQITPEAFAELVAAAEALKLSPSAVLRMSLRALRETLGGGEPWRATRLVGAERGRLGRCR